MCTAIANNGLFGRNLDVTCDYGGEITIMPRGYSLTYCHEGEIGSRYTVMGTAKNVGKYPLFFDAFNEKGLCAAGLNFVGNAFYNKKRDNKTNLTHYEIIPYILGKCADIVEARCILENLNITDDCFSAAMGMAELHWIFSDKNRSLTVEQTEEGLKIFENPFGVLTNNPPFGFMSDHLKAFMALSPKPPANNFTDKISLSPDSLGLGAYGLPGDYSSRSRFVKAAFLKLNSVSYEDRVNQMFHILSSVSQPRGATETARFEYEITDYSVCFDTDSRICYYRTYGNSRISAVRMTDAKNLQSFKMIRDNDILFQN